MKRLLIIAAIIMVTAGAAWAVDLVAVFGSGITTCVLAATKTSLIANNSDSAVLSLTVNGSAYGGSDVTITEQGMGHTATNQSFPQTITASAPGTWMLSVTAPSKLVGQCAVLTITAN